MTSGRETCFGSRMDRALWTVIVREALGFSPVAADGGNGFRQHTGAVSRGPRARSRGSFSREVLDQQGDPGELPHPRPQRSEEHTSELQSLMRISYAVFCLKQKK